MTTPSGRALAGMLAVFAEFERDILRDRVRAGIAQARKEGTPHGRPQTITKHAQKVRNLFKKGISKRAIATLEYKQTFSPKAPGANRQGTALQLFTLRLRTLRTDEARLFRPKSEIRVQPEGKPL